MEKFIINGGERLRGELRLHGAKNSALPILAATLLADSPSVLHNCPDLTDVDYSIKILEHLGCKVRRSGNDVEVDPSGIGRCDIPKELMCCMRSSIIFLGAILARVNRATLTPPGGCKIGLRPIDLHLAALKSLGMECEISDDVMECGCPAGLHGTRINLKFPSVGATENILLAAVTANGDTIIENAAREPEIVDLADFLNKMGARVYGAGEKRIVIEGVSRLHGAEHSVIPDRIVASTIMAAGAITGGDIVLKSVNPLHLSSVIPAFEEMGCRLDIWGDELRIASPERLRRLSVVQTMPHPGFPTDSQALFMALACVADGTSMFVENIFENRYRHVEQLCAMGADIRVDGRMAVVNGIDKLHGARVDAEDLRGGAALIIAGLAAQGITEVGEIEHIDRGYELVENMLTSLGAKIKRERV
ncbi:MAG: UDP-N-acetylglucosamine 1-carboxyvinyltransferase [Clostridia bacterium]|nr:UDP-N-acetylglucosamine 1-carboxyvinyltransferase [Clostridia bacterium]